MADSEDYQAFQGGLLALSSDSKAMKTPDMTHTVNPQVFIRAIGEVTMVVRTRTRLHKPAR